MNTSIWLKISTPIVLLLLFSCEQSKEDSVVSTSIVQSNHVEKSPQELSELTHLEFSDGKLFGLELGQHIDSLSHYRSIQTDSITGHLFTEVKTDLFTAKIHLPTTPLGYLSSFIIDFESGSENIHENICQYFDDRCGKSKSQSNFHTWNWLSKSSDESYDIWFYQKKQKKQYCLEIK